MLEAQPKAEHVNRQTGALFQKELQVYRNQLETS